MNGLKPNTISEARKAQLARVSRGMDSTDDGHRRCAGRLSADLAGAPPVPAPPPEPTLPERIGAALASAPPDWDDFRRTHPDAARRINRQIGLRYGGSLWTVITAAHNQDVPGAVDAVMSRLARLRAEAMRAWMEGQHDSNGNG